MQQLLPGPLAESAQATIILLEDVLTKDMEIVPRAPPSTRQLVRKGAVIASRSRSLNERRKIT
jgi:hypothetical protein